MGDKVGSVVSGMLTRRSKRVDPKDPVVSTATAKKDWFLTSQHLRQIPSTGGGAIWGAGRLPTYYSVRALDRLALKVHGKEGLAEKREKRKRRQEKSKVPKPSSRPTKQVKRDDEASLALDANRERNLQAHGMWTPDPSSECEDLELRVSGKKGIRGKAIVTGCPVTLNCQQLGDETMDFKAVFKTARESYTGVMTIQVLNKNKLHVECFNGGRGRAQVHVECNAQRRK